jgi:hypothetical protein
MVSVSPGKADYMKAASVSMERLYGVRLSEIHQDLDPKLVRMDAARGAGETPEAYVGVLATQYGLLARSAAEGLTDADLRSRNLRAAALLPVMVEHPEWQAIGDGALYAPGDEGVFKMAPDLDNTGKVWGFSMSISVGAELVHNGNRSEVEGGADFERIGGGLDISGALKAYENRLQNPGLGRRMN